STVEEVHKQKVNERERLKKLRDTLRSKSTDQEVHKQKVNQRERRKKLRDTLRSKSTDQEVHKQKVNQRERRKKLRDTLRSKSTDQEVHKQKVNERERLKRLRKQRISMRTAEENEQEILKSRERVKTHRKKTRQFAFPELLKKQRSVNNYRKSTKRHQQNVQTAIKKFKNNIRDYAKYKCPSCKRFFLSKYNRRVAQEMFKGKKPAHGFEWICLTCRSYLKKQRLPLQAQANNLEVPAAPPVLSELSSLEVRLLCKRYPFMKLVALPKGRQSGIKGSVVNVPVNCEQVCSTLPRTPGTAGIIPLKLKRKQQYKGYVKFQYIRPEKIMLALRWLQKHNVHYKNIEENSSWLDDTLNEDQDTFNELIKDKPTLEDDDTDTSQIIMQTNDNEKVSSSSHTQVVSSSDSDSDIENANDPGDTLRGLHYDTCVQSVNPNLDVDKILSIAPGENKIPMSILMDTNFEEMSFPSLFPTGQFGFRAERPVELTAKTYFQERLLDASTNFARDVEYLFVAQTIIERQQIQDSMSVALRKTYTADENEQLTASIVKDTSLDQAYRYLQPVRGSPPYWQKVQLKLLSAIKQFGIFTWFFTLSAADLRWYDTIQEILSQKGIEKTEAAIDAMTWEQKCDILRSNPVSAARHFQFRLDLFMKDMILSDSQPLGHVRHFFYRIEFQQRGSPHAHGVLWIDDAPDVEHSKPEDVSEFIDKYVQCSLPAGNEDPELFALVNQVQRHSHTASCRKSGKQCRFGFPRPLSSKTILSKPPDLSETLPHLIPVLRQNNLKIAGVVNEFLEKTENLENMTYEEVLKACQLPANVYQEALSKSASSPKRDPNSVNISNYNASLLSAWQANLDVQFVTDPYACIQYVVSYITKDEREMGSLLHAVAKESAQDTIKEQMKKCGQAFLNSRSVTAQEAAYRALGLPLYKSNFSTVWIPTGLPSQRISLLKPSYVLQRLDDMDNDVFVSGIADKYSKRPGVLEMWCLAQFATWYEPTQKDKVQSDFQPDILTDHYNIGENAVDTSVEDAPKVIKVQLPSSVCVMRKRKKQCVIRFHKFSQEKQPESHYHSQLYLFLPWRNEIEDLQDRYDSYEESYNNHKLTIDKCRSTLFRHEKLVEAAFEQLQAEDQPREAWNQLAAENQQEEYDAEDEGVALDEDHAILHPGDQENLSVNISTPAKDCVQGLAIESMPSVLPYNDYCRHVRTLNTEQYQVFQVILNWCVRYMQSVNNTTVQKPDPIHLFISGGAGTGKSHLISALYQTIELNLRKEGDTPDCPKVLLLAPTGTAAFNIQGATIHAALLFSLLQQSASRKSSSATTHPLSDDKRNTLRVKMSQLKFIIIDEISMVASDFFVEIHKRLTEIFAVEDIFGGLSIITVGDMYQLPPVAARFIFEPPRNAFAALCPSLWSTHFSYIELSQIMRQADDQTFSEMLNRVRTASHSAEDISALKTRLVNKGEVNLDDFLHVFATNAQVDAHNMERLNRLPGEIISLYAVDKKPSSLKSFNFSEKDSFTGGLPQVVTLKIGARVILTRNVDVSDGLTNGTQGRVLDVKFSSSGAPVAVIILFDSSAVGKNAHLNSRVDLSAYKEPVVPICQVEAKFSPTSSKATASRKQFPLRLCWATSIHKVQGATLNNIVVSFEKRFNPGQAYVAISRVRKLCDLYLTSFEERKITTNAKVTHEMNRMKQEALHSNPFAAVSDKYSLNIALLNAQANVYANNIKYYERQGWTLKFLEKSSVENCHGLLFFCKENCSVVSCTSSYVPHLEQLFVELSSTNCVSSLCLVYRSPSTTPGDFITDMTATVSDRAPDVLLGDFNIKLGTAPYRQLSQQLQDYQQVVTSPTHLSGSTIDLVFTQLANPYRIDMGLMRVQYRSLVV
ncbi:PIF1-like protein, partial [Mya arenaria]